MRRSEGDLNGGVVTQVVREGAKRSTAAVIGGDDLSARRIAGSLEAAAVDVPLTCETPERLREGEQVDAVVYLCAAGTARAKREILEIRRNRPETPVVAVVPAASGRKRRLVGLGAAAEGTVDEERVDEALLPTLHAVLAGQVVLPKSAHRRSGPVVLSHRERQVLRFAVEGMTNDAIARTLFLSVSTVKSHLTSAFSKLSVSSRSEAAAVLLDPEEPASRLVFGGLGGGQ